MRDETKIMQKAMKSVRDAWDQLSPAGRTYLKTQFEALDVNAPQKEDVDQERV